MADDELIDLQKVKLEAADKLTFASAVTVDNPEIWRRAREYRAGVKKLYAGIEKHFKRMKAPWDEGKKKILAEEKLYAGPCEDALELLDPKILAFEEELIRDRAELQRRLQEQARQRAMDEQLAEAGEAEKDGDHERAQQILNRQLFVPPVVLPDLEKEFYPGEGRNEGWAVDADTIDLMTLAKAVVEGQVAANLIAPNTQALNAIARALKETFNVPGCRAIKRRGITQRG